MAATPTEASAASLPIGATVGPAGLPVMPYDLTYFGRFFDMADVFADLDARVQAGDGKRGLRTNGRLITIDGFALTADPKRGFPSVAGDIAVTTYVVPPEQGIAAGANPAGPAPAGVDDGAGARIRHRRAGNRNDRIGDAMKTDGKINVFARDLYRDLRDRRLLPVVALLLVGIVAVPLLIKGGDSGPPPSGAPFADADPFDGAAELRPVVVDDDPGLRNYHERLDGSPSRNPFKQQLVPKAIVSDTGSSSTGSGTGLQTQETATDSATSSDTSDLDGQQLIGQERQLIGQRQRQAGMGRAAQERHGPQVQDRREGRARREHEGRGGRRVLTLLPSAGHPIVQYTGSDNGGTRASFAVSGDVVTTEGEGVCKPTPADCRFLNMRIGQQKKLRPAAARPTS